MRRTIGVFIAAGFLFSGVSQASMPVMKAYKQAFPGDSVKCSSCHVNALPKKAEGQHDWNAYGTSLKKAVNAGGLGNVATNDDIAKLADIINQQGKVEDFKN